MVQSASEQPRLFSDEEAPVVDNYNHPVLTHLQIRDANMFNQSDYVTQPTYSLSQIPEKIQDFYNSETFVEQVVLLKGMLESLEAMETRIDEQNIESFMVALSEISIMAGLDDFTKYILPKTDKYSEADYIFKLETLTPSVAKHLINKSRKLSHERKECLNAFFEVCPQRSAIVKDYLMLFSAINANQIKLEDNQLLEDIENRLYYKKHGRLKEKFEELPILVQANYVEETSIEFVNEEGEVIHVPHIAFEIKDEKGRDLIFVTSSNGRPVQIRQRIPTEPTESQIKERTRRHAVIKRLNPSYTEVREPLKTIYFEPHIILKAVKKEIRDGKEVAIKLMPLNGKAGFYMGGIHALRLIDNSWIINVRDTLNSDDGDYSVCTNTVYAIRKLPHEDTYHFRPSATMPIQKYEFGIIKRETTYRPKNSDQEPFTVYLAPNIEGIEEEQNTVLDYKPIPMELEM